MRKAFFIKLAIMILPYLLILAFPFFVMFSTKETKDIDDVVDMQTSAKRTTLLGKAYTGNDRYYKLRSIKIKHPDIIAFGSSRALQFRSKMFIRNNKFFNASRIAINPYDLLDFWSKIASKDRPKIVIVTIDQWWMAANYTTYNAQLPPENYSKAGIEEVLGTWQKVYRDYFLHKITLRRIWNAISEKPGFDRVGEYAYVLHNGFRNDGSYYTGSFLKNATYKINWENMNAKLEKGEDFYSHSKTLSQAAMVAIERFLDTCEKENVHVVGFMPPIVDTVYKRMQSMPEYYGFYNNIYGSLSPEFVKRGFSLFDFTDIKDLGSNANEIDTDVLHPSEKATLRMLIKMAQYDTVLSKEVDIPFLTSKLISTKGDRVVFNLNEY